MTSEKKNRHSWIFLRGLGRHAAHWGEFPELFKKAFPDDTVELLDLAGSGTEQGRESYLQIESYVEDLRRRARNIRKGPVSLLAISMGAMIASAWAKKYPNEIERLVLINTSSKSSSRFFERLRPRNYFSIVQMMRREKDVFFREKAILRMTAEQLPHRDRVAEERSRMETTKPANFLRQLIASSQYSFPQEAPVKTLFLAAEGDNLVNPICSKRLAEQWKMPLRMHPQGDHDLPLVAPEWIIDQVKKWPAT